MPTIDIQDLVKTYGPVRALNGLTMQVERGAVHGFLGPNGSGKTTTIRALLGLLRPDGGSVVLLGANPWTDGVALHRRLAYVPGDVSLWPELTGGEALDILGRLRGGPDSSKRRQLCERFDLDLSRKCRTYSKGNRQKVAIVAALSANVELLLLDEPTSGLDPLMEVVFRECILEQKAAGRTVLLSSHLLSQVDILCDSVTIIRQGQAVESGALDDLRHLRRTSISVETERPAEALAQLPGVHDFRVENGRAHFEVDSEHLERAIRHIAALGVKELVSQPPTLEQMFIRYYGTSPDADMDASPKGRDAP